MNAHLSAYSSARQATMYEYIVPMTDAIRPVTLFENNKKQHSLPGSNISSCLRPRMYFSSPCFVRASRNSLENQTNKCEDSSCQYSPEFPLNVLKAVTLALLEEAVHSVRKNVRDPIGGSVELLLVPLLQLLHTLLLMGVYHHSDLQRVLSLILPAAYMRDIDGGELMCGDGENDCETVGEEKDGRAVAEQRTLLQMKLPEAVKLQVHKTIIIGMKFIFF